MKFGIADFISTSHNRQKISRLTEIRTALNQNKGKLTKERNYKRGKFLKKVKQKIKKAKEVQSHLRLKSTLAGTNNKYPTETMFGKPFRSTTRMGTQHQSNMQSSS